MKKACIIGILISLIIGVKVEACEIDLKKYRELEVYNSYVVGEYMFDTSSGFTPSLEDFAIASRTIKDGEKEYIYSILDVPVFSEYRVREVFENKVSEEESKFPYLDLTYNYRANIRGAKKEDYDIFTCKSEALRVNYTALYTEGESEYKTKAIRYVSVSSTEEIGEAKYCITEEEECDPREEIEIKENPGIIEIEYGTHKEEQRICVEVKDGIGNTSEVICDEVTVKVDKDSAKVEATEELSEVKEGEPHGVEKLFNVSYSVSGGKKNHYYYQESGEEKTKYLLTNMSDLPSGEVEVEVMVRGGNGLISKGSRIIEVEKNKVTYDYKTNGGTSVEKESQEVIYEGRADLSVKAEKAGYEFVGWNTEKDATYGLESVEVKEDITLYAIYKKELTGRYEILEDEGKMPAVSSEEESKCIIYNNEESCKIKIATISAKVGYEAIGWSKIKGSHEASYYGSEEDEIKEDTTYYSVTREKTGITGIFNHYVDGKIEREVVTCYLYNGEDTCKIDTSKIVNDDYKGRKFIGYTESKEDIKKEADIIELKSGKEYYAYYEDTYEIKYKSGENEEEIDEAHVYFIIESTGVSQKVEEKEIKDLKEKSGYEAVGWTEEKEGVEVEKEAGEKIKVEEATEYYGIYKREVKVKYTSVSGTKNIPEEDSGYVYYNAYSGTERAAEIKLDTAEKIEREEYMFKSWKAEGKEYDAGEIIKIKEDTELEAEWTLSGCIITLDYKTNGGVRADKTSITYITGSEAVDLSEVKAYKPGWTFVGWGVDKNATTNPFITYKPATGETRVTLYAMFKKTIQVSYRIQDDETLTMEENANRSYEIYNNETSYEITLPEVKVEKQGYEFIGWSTESETEEKDYSAQEKVKISENKVFYTVSKNTEALVSRYHYYDGEEKKVEEKKCYRYNKSDTCKTKSDIKNKEYNKGILVGFSKSKEKIEEATEQEISKNTDYYGIYDRVISVTYTSGIAGITKVIESAKMNYLTQEEDMKVIGATIELENADGISGYQTLGWRKDKEGGEATQKEKDEVVIETDTEYYAVYKKQIELSYASMGGEETRETQIGTIYYNSNMPSIEVEYEFELAEGLTRVGYNFQGWLVENNSQEKYEAKEKISIKKNTKMYATWTPRDYKVTYDYIANGGNVASEESSTVAYLSKVNLNPTAEKPGYEFVGWNTNINATVGLTELEMPAEDIILYAIYRKEVKATWELVDKLAGRIEEDTTTCYKYNNEEMCQIETGNLIANTGYAAVGWSKTKGEATVDAGNDIFTNIGSDTTYYSVTRKVSPLVGTFYYNVDTTIKTLTSSCVLYNGASSCEVTSPVKPLLYKTVPFVGWSSQRQSYVEGNMTIDKNTNYYAYYTQILEITYYEGATNKMTSYTNPIKYILSETGEYASIPSITIKEPENMSDYQTLGWREDTTKGEATQNSKETINYTESHTYYAVYKRTITLGYNANEGTGSIANQTDTQYYNAETGCTSHKFTLASGSALSRTGWTFNGWLEGSATGTKYAAESEITITKDTIMFASWQLNKYKVTLSGSQVSYQNASGTGISSIDVYYGKTATIKAVPASGYYFSSISCTSGYSIAGFKSGTSYYVTQTLTLTNNSYLGNGTCTIGMHRRSYSATYVSKTCTGQTNCRTEEYCTDHYDCDPWDCSGCWGDQVCSVNCGSQSFGYVCCDNYKEHTVCDSYEYECGNYTCPNGGSLSGSTCYF